MNKELNEEERERKIQKRKDVFTVLAILSSVFVSALLIAWFKSGERIIKRFTGSSMSEAREIYRSAKNVIMGMGILCLILLLVYIAYSIKEKKKRKRSRKEKKAFIDYDRLEMARVRVEKARMEAKKQGKKISSDNGKYERLKAIDDSEYENAYGRKPRQQGMTAEEYRRRRKEEYERYMDMDFDEDMEASDNPFMWDGLENDTDDYEYYTLWDKIKIFISAHRLAIGIIAVVGAIAAISYILVSILV